MGPLLHKWVQRRTIIDPISIAVALSQFAPTLIKYFTGSDKAATVAQQVVGIAQTVTGTTGPIPALAAIQQDPKAAMDFQIAIMSQEAELDKAYLADVQSARALQVSALAQDDLFSKRFVYYFAAGWSLFAMIYFAAVTFYPPPADGTHVADTILGVLISTVLGSMIAYFYGSTKGSAEKTRLLAQSQPQK